MEFRAIRKKEEGYYVTRYDVIYRTKDGKTKVYEMVSRNHNITTLEELHGEVADAVIIIAMDEKGEKILLNKEFRMAPGQWVYNFPAGLVEVDEDPKDSAKRELWEETGLELYEIDDYLDTSYSALGFSNETNVCVIGKARGEFRESTSANEEIHAGWFSKEEVRELLKTERFAARTQSYCYLWSKE